VTADNTTPITRDDLQASFQAFKDDIDRSADQAASRAVPFAIAGGVLVLVLAYLIGKRVGKRTSTVVEIRRI
jgi:hypothetical protein